MQFNGAVYHEDWKNVQIGLFDPGVLGNLTFTTNGPDYRVRGFETEIIGRVTTGLTVTLRPDLEPHRADQHADPRRTRTGKPVDFAALGLRRIRIGMNGISAGAVARRSRATSGCGTSSPSGATMRSSRERPPAADSSFSTTDRLALENDGKTHVYYLLPGFTTYDMSVGVAKDQWTAQIYGTNITDSRGDVFSTYAQRIKRIR